MTVLVAVKPLRLLRVTEGLFRERRGLRIVGRIGAAAGLPRLAGRLAPDLVVASVRVLGREHAAICAAIRRSSPGSKVILIHSVPVLRLAHRQEVVVHLEEGALVRSLMPSVDRLVGGSGPAS